ncbi:hypothetical protein [Streptococcus pneumoniae]|uniref:hypothetical protein n=1 Tax=Streptococcus pneumoniae TaxID=1313 RepID=UPI001D175175|nr:hypothetical protein [Streptococcus pneumoniae]
MIGHMGLFFYTKIGSIISIRDLPTTNIIEPKNNPERGWSLSFLCSLGAKGNRMEKMEQMCFLIC